MEPFFEKTLGFKLVAIKEAVPYVAQFFAIPFDSTQPDQGDTLAKSVLVEGQPE
jgi:hypothetical protein